MRSLYKSSFARMLIAFFIAMIAFVPTMPVSADVVQASSFQVRQESFVAACNDVFAMPQSLKTAVGNKETINPGFSHTAYSKIKVGKLMIDVLHGYKERPGWQYRERI